MSAAPYVCPDLESPRRSPPRGLSRTREEAAVSTSITWLTAAQAAEHADCARRSLTAGRAGVKLMTVRQWVCRGYLEPGGQDAHGRQLFRLADVADAERATRDRALRLVGIGAT